MKLTMDNYLKTELKGLNDYILHYVKKRKHYGTKIVENLIISKIDYRGVT